MNDIDFSPNGEWLASAGYDATLRLSKFRLDDLLDIACEVAGRNLQIGLVEEPNVDLIWIDEWSPYRLGESYRPTCMESPLALSTINYVTNQVKAYAMSGDQIAASGRLKQLVHWLRINGQSDEYGIERVEWLESLQVGENPWEEE